MACRSKGHGQISAIHPMARPVEAAFPVARHGPYTKLVAPPGSITLISMAVGGQSHTCASSDKLVLRLPLGIRPRGIRLLWGPRAALGIATFCVLFAAATKPARAQWRQPAAGDLSNAIRVDEVDSSAGALLERVRANAAQQQWDEAVETLRQVMGQEGGKLIRLDDRRFIPVLDYCQMRLAELPSSARSIYRGRVDPLAKRWYDEGIANRDPDALRRVVDQLFLSSWTDKALLALGDIELEQGDFAEARWCWERISPELRTADGRPWWLDLRTSSDKTTARNLPESGLAAQWLAYPDSHLNLADVRARLVLASILEGSLTRARLELADLNRRNPGDTGKIAGRTGPYSVLLAGMLAKAEQRPPAVASSDWPTMAGSFQRTTTAANPGLDTAWIIDLPMNRAGPYRTDINLDREAFGLPERPPAEDPSKLLCFYPLVVGNLVLLNSTDKIFAFDLASGKPAWPVPADTKDREPGEIYSGLTGRENLQAALTEVPNQFHTFGVPRFTMSVVGGRLYARLGSPITERPQALGLTTGNTYLVCLDLAAEGRLVWRIPQTSSDDDRWAFEGSPVCDGDNVYVAMRYNDVEPQEHVACYDAPTGALRWRKLICAAESPARGQVEGISNNLITLDHHTLYLNTNLGAVAAISTIDGQIRWLSLYPRARQTCGSDTPANFYRDLNPCVFYRGSVLTAPTDSEAILSLDSATGRLLWASPYARDVVHLLGVGGGNLLASGQRLWWLNVDNGKVLHRWPDQVTVHGYGRGALVGEDVYFPIRTEIHVFRQSLSPANGPPTNADPFGIEVRDPIRLDARDPALQGGNLIVANGYMLIATPDKLIALGPRSGGHSPREHQVTQAAANSPIDSAERNGAEQASSAPACAINHHLRIIHERAKMIYKPSLG